MVDHAQLFVDTHYGHLQNSKGLHKLSVSCTVKDTMCENGMLI